jgi:hypothetical protein
MDLPAFARPADRSATPSAAIEMPMRVTPQGQQFNARAALDEAAE